MTSRADLFAGGKALVQTVISASGAVATGTTVIPMDDTIPQITEGNEFLTQAITPKDAANILEITAGIYVSHSVTAWLQSALFQDATANALAAGSLYQGTATARVFIPLFYRMIAGTTSSTTFRIRAAGEAAGTTTFNGHSGGRAMGGVMSSFLMIKEYTP